MTILTLEKARVLANDYGLPIKSVKVDRSVPSNVWIYIGNLHFPYGTTVQHARMVLNCKGKTDAVSQNTYNNHRWQ